MDDDVIDNGVWIGRSIGGELQDTPPLSLWSALPDWLSFRARSRRYVSSPPARATPAAIAGKIVWFDSLTLRYDTAGIGSRNEKARTQNAHARRDNSRLYRLSLTHMAASVAHRRTLSVTMTASPSPALAGLETNSGKARTHLNALQVVFESEFFQSVSYPPPTHTSNPRYKPARTELTVFPSPSQATNRPTTEQQSRHTTDADTVARSNKLTTWSA